MDCDRYCVDQAAPPGSSLHYATLFVGARERAVLVAIHALRHVLLAIVDSIADPNVRAHKLNWWSGEIMEARDGRARHPAAVAITGHCGKRLWRRAEVLAMLSAIAGASTANGLASQAARDRFCEGVGGGTAQLCASAVAFDPGEAAPNDIHVLGTALEGAILAGAPIARSGLGRIPISASDSVGGVDQGHSGASPERIAKERARAHQVLADAVHGMSRRAGPAVLVYRTLSLIQLAALAAALRKPARKAPLAATVSPLRKLWIAYWASRGAERVDF